MAENSGRTSCPQEAYDTHAAGPQVLAMYAPLAHLSPKSQCIPLVVSRLACLPQDTCSSEEPQAKRRRRAGRDIQPPVQHRWDPRRHASTHHPHPLLPPLTRSLLTSIAGTLAPTFSSVLVRAIPPLPTTYFLPMHLVHSTYAPLGSNRALPGG